jgi:hypothetical protein
MPIASIKIWVLLIFFGCTVFLTLNRHSRYGVENYHSEIWADKAGYYIYLPSVFIYSFQGKLMPSDIDIKTGNGFSIKDGKIITKYTYGVALMQSPIFIACHYFSKYFGFNANGFSLLYYKSIDISAVIYSFISFIFLYLFLIRYLSKRVSILTLICLYLGTNIFYYSIFETGMSHIYSFFLFTCFLYLGPYVTKHNQNKIFYLLFGLIIGLIIIVRPINIIFLPVFFIFNPQKLSDIKNNLTKLPLVAITTLIVIIPQLIYWKYSFGDYFCYSYQDERFSNIFNPKFLELWFSTNNGLFIYNPLIILILIGLAFLYKESPKKSIIIGVYFIFISFVFSSWHVWSYGCSFGCRPYVEYYSILALPFGFFIDKLNSKFFFKPVLVSLLIIFIIYNQKLIFSYDGCWYGSIWDWSELLKLLLSSTK